MRKLQIKQWPSAIFKCGNFERCGVQKNEQATKVLRLTENL